ncbi:MAG TPA: DUF4157 domain-containing protein, partial [Kofleriaceae bacterium]|nr:DUF4157 domain-containing protein [Kofleriaceae bacterium]
LEPALGADLGGVRVHTGAASASAADALQAKAYAVGKDIHFGAGAYDPSSKAGKHLIAHEVAHTVQQGGGAGTVQRSAVVSSPGDAAERQADSFADAFTSGGSTRGMVTPGMSLSASVFCFGRDEHRDIPTKHLTELQQFLGTPEGKKWAKDHGYDADELLKRMQNDPAAKGEKLHGPGNKSTEFSYGEVTALMGDLYKEWKDLGNEKQDKKDALMHANSTAEYQKLTGGKYVDLAKNNDSHFAGKNLESWRKHHVEALDAARKSGLDKEFLNQALFIDAAGAHYMTDAFSAGHQFVKAIVLQHVREYLATKPIKTKNPQMQTYVGSLGDGNVSQMMMLLIHDRMNVEGFEVVNGKGMKWKTLGDGELSKSPETQRIAALAVFESRQQVIAASEGKLGGDLDAEIQKVADFFPNAETQERANLTAIGYIPWAAEHVEELIYKERGSAPGEFASRVPIIGGVIGHVVESNLDAIGDPSRENQILRNQELDRATGRDRDGGRIEPSFTIKRF